MTGVAEASPKTNGWETLKDDRRLLFSDQAETFATLEVGETVRGEGGILGNEVWWEEIVDTRVCSTCFPCANECVFFTDRSEGVIEMYLRTIKRSKTLIGRTLRI